jgi:VacB/RNase II family 3'-5' exoribonuclease
MTNQNSNHNQLDFEALARQSLAAHGFQPAFSPAVEQQLAELRAHSPAVQPTPQIRDMRSLFWSSIDNDTSRDLDQIEYVEQQKDGDIRVFIGVADVDAFVPKGSAIDEHAEAQTSTLYTGVTIFPMIPEELSTGTTSLLENQDRLAIVVQYDVGSDGHLHGTDIYRAIVNNKAQLAYPSVGAWLEGRGEAPPKVAASTELQAQLKLQDQAAQELRGERYRHGALTIEGNEVQPVTKKGDIVDIEDHEKNRATELIEDFMVAANEVVARYLIDVPSIRRIVKTPKRWDRIVQLAAQSGTTLPAEPDSKALNDFLCERQKADPDHFADLSLAVVKLMGPGEYILEKPGDTMEGHFGLAVRDYAHSTAPNRRYADVITQRLIKAKLAQEPQPYTAAELDVIAQHLTERENAARKVEREMSKRLTAIAMRHHIGEDYNGIVTGVGEHGTFVRVLKPHMEGLLVHGQQGADVGDRMRVKLVSADPQRGYIDFARVNGAH